MRFLLFGLALLPGVFACTNILVSKSASADGSTQLAYNADSGALYGSLGHYPARKNIPSGTRRQVWDWDGSFFLGTIPEASETFNVVGNCNEHGLIIGETTFGGLEQLDGHNTGALVDYGSLIWITLQRAKTAREAIALMDSILREFGYASDGESFSIADPNEIWLMELIGKGNATGAVWVASRVPEGHIGSTANQARTRTFNQTDPENVLFAKDVVTFAVSQGLFPADADPNAFDFSATYDPPSPVTARLAEARVWNIFNRVSAAGTMDSYLDYAQGRNMTNRMPLFIKVSQKLHVNDTMELMRTHFEGTWFDNTGTTNPDLGAGPGHSAYRWRPLTWKSGEGSYLNERTVGVQQTAWAFVGQSRSWMPRQMAALFWFAPDDSATAIRIPLYGGVTRIPSSFGGVSGQDPAAGVPYAVEADAYNMNMDSAFWIYNLVANIAYGERYNDVYPLIQQEIHKYQGKFFTETATLDKTAAALFREGQEEQAVELITKYCETTGNWMTGQWRNFWMFLFSRTRDGFTTIPPKKPQCKHGQTESCTSRLLPDTQTTGYNKEWYARMVADPANRAHYQVPGSTVSAADERKMLRMDKQRRLS